MVNKVKTLDVRNSRPHIMASTSPSKGGELRTMSQKFSLIPLLWRG